MQQDNDIWQYVVALTKEGIPTWILRIAVSIAEAIGLVVVK